MKAIVYTTFGNSDVIKVIETEKPTIKDDEVLIKSFAVSVNPADIKYRKGQIGRASCRERVLNLV